jgi:hypothetical protein
LNIDRAVADICANSLFAAPHKAPGLCGQVECTPPFNSPLLEQGQFSINPESFVDLIQLEFITSR